MLTTVRHAATAWSEEGRYAGSQDIPLSDSGRQQVEEARPSLDPDDYDVVLTSPMRRAQETAELLLPGRDVQVLEGSHERCFGELEGRTWEDALAWRPPLLLIEVGADRHSVNPPGGEPFEEVFWRARTCAHRIHQEHRDRRVLLVAHGVFLTMLHGYLLGKSCIESLTIHPHNLELTCFELDETGRARSSSSRQLARSRGLGF